MNIPKIIVHALFSNSQWNFLPSFFCYDSSSFWNSFIFGNAAYRQMIFIWIYNYVYISVYTLYLCVYFVSLLDRFCSLFCLFLNLLSSCLHTRYNVNVASYQIKSNQSLCILLLNIYAIIRYKYINMYIQSCYAHAWHARQRSPAALWPTLLAKVSTLVKTTFHSSSAAQTAIVHVYSLSFVLYSLWVCLLSMYCSLLRSSCKAFLCLFYGPLLISVCFAICSSTGPELEFRSPRAKLLWTKWRDVWMLSWERQRLLHEHLMYLKDVERARNFSWDDWRKRVSTATRSI